MDMLNQHRDKVIIPLSLFFVFISWNINCSNSHVNETKIPWQTAPNIKLVNSKKVLTFTDSRDGATYTVVKIGEQFWMGENLRYLTEGSWLNPDNPSEKYGRLYDGVTAQNICPPGWHLPSDQEWNKLENTLGMTQTENKKTGWRGKHGVALKSLEDWAVGEGNNSSGFNALPAGYYNIDSGFEGMGYSTGYWSLADNNLAWMRWLGAPLTGVNRYFDDLSKGMATASCRCLMD